MPPGSPNLFRHELGNNLNKVFPPPQGGFEIPQVLSGVVSLTHDFPGTEPYRGWSLTDLVGSADVVQIISAVSPPNGYIWIVDEMSIHCTDAVARAMRLCIRYVGGGGTFVVTVARITSEAAPNNLPYPVGRRLILPPGALLDLSVPALTAGANLRFTAAYLQVPAGQFVPKN